MLHQAPVRRRAFVALAFLAALTVPAAAQEWPTRPVRLVVPQTPGGATDVLARWVGQKLGERWGHPVVIENRAGAAGNIGTDFVAKAPADGYTLLFTYAGSQAINQALYPRLPFDPVKDFQPVATMAVVPFFMVVSPKFPARDLRELIAMAKARPDELTYASSGNGSVNHLLGEMVKTETGTRIVHVPYKGVAPSLTDVISGQVNAAFASVPSVIQLMQSGTLRAIAVSSARRSSAAPDVPTIAEQGVPGFDVSPWWGILAPAGTPRAIVDKINADVAAAVNGPDAPAFLATQGATAYLGTPEQFLDTLKSDVEKWAKVVKASGAKVD